MLGEIIQQLNWLDIFVVIVLFRMSYVAVKNGILGEFFKLAGTISALYLSLHYYTTLSDSVKAKFMPKTIPLDFLDFLCFLLLAEAGYLFFVLLREGITHLIKFEVIPKLNKFGGLVLGIARALLFSSLVMFCLAISTMSYFQKSVDTSYSGKRLLGIAPATYAKIWNGVASKFMLKEKFNPTVDEVTKKFKL